jgi:hypothetical protein
MAGRVLIAATGELDRSLSVNPSFSFFTKKYSKHTNYATENYKITFPEKVFTDDFLDVPIPQKYGDILRGVVLSFVADPTDVARLGSNLYPVDVFGISVIDYVELYVGEHKIDTVTGDDIFIDRELNVSESYRSSVNVLHGNPFQGSGESEFVQEFLDGQYNTRGINPFNTEEYRIHIPFYFHRRPGSGFPLCSIYNQEMSLRIKLRPAIDVLFATQNKLGDATLWDPEANNRILQQLELNNFTVNLDLVHLDKQERCMLQRKPLNILFEQRQRNVFLINERSKTGTFQLNFANCVKELFFVAKKYGHWTQDQIAILNRIHALDSLTSSQVSIINDLRQSLYRISIWEEIIRIAMSRLTGVTDLGVRKNVVDVLRQTVVWGPTQLTLLTNVEDNTTDIPAATTALIQYLYTIPNLIVNTQTTVDTELGRLPTITDQFGRSNIIASLLALQNVWGVDQIAILNSLIDPNVQNESLLIFQLRTFVAQLSYFLVGLSSLVPGSPEQLNVVNGLAGYLNDLTVQSDILKLGMVAVLNTLTGQTDAQRSAIVDGLIRIGAEATIWGSPQLVLLETLRNAFNDANIPTLVSYLNGLSGDIDQRVRIKGIIFVLGEFPGTLAAARLERVTALRQFRVWRDDPIKLVNSLTSLTPGASGRADVINSLIEYSNVLIDEVPTLQFTLNNLKNGVNGILDTIATLTTTAERDPLIVELVALGVWSSDQLATLDALRIPSANDTTYITQLKATSTQVPITQSIQNDIIQKLLTRSYWGNQIFTLNNLRLVVPGFIGQTALVAALNTYIAGLPSSLNIVTSLNAVVAATTQAARDPLIDSLIALGVWSSAQVVTLNALRVPGFNDTSTLIPEVNTRIDILKIGFSATLDSIPAIATKSERDPIIDSLIALGTGIWGSTELANLDLLRTPSGSDGTYVTSLKAFIGAVSTPKSIMLDNGVATSVRGFNFSNTYLTSNVITPLTDPLPPIQENRNEFVSNLVAETGLWGSSQLTLLEELRSDTPTGYIDRLTEYVKGVLSTLAVGYVDKTDVELNTINTTLSTNPLPSIIINRNDFVSNLEAETGVWGSEQNTLLTSLRTSTTPTTLTEQLTEYINGILYQSLTPTTKIESELNTIITTLETDPLPDVGPDRTTFIDGLVAETNVWGASQLTLLNDLRTTTPDNHINRLIQYVKGILYELLTGTTKTESELNAIITTLETDPLPPIVVNRNEFVSNLEAITGLWEAGQLTLLNDLRTTTPTGHIDRLKEYVNGVLSTLAAGYVDRTTVVLQGIIDLLGDPLPSIFINRNDFVSNLEAIQNLWDANRVTLLNNLRTTDTSASLATYVTTLRDTIIALNSDSPDTTNRGVLVNTLLGFLMWGATQRTLLDVEFRVVGSQDHAAIINGLVTYLGGLRTLALTYHNPSTGLGLLRTLLNTLDGALHTTIVGLLQQAADTVWDGYFFRLLEELKNESIVVGTETTHISQLQEYVNITFFTASLSRNIVYLLTQPTVKYPPSVFNKWARGKKHVPLMYSKQNKTTLECDGETIINETTGNNLFLSTSLSNIHHKRSPVFRNINMYSFALHPGELEPSGHMNFSGVKDARVTMDLEYDGSQGTFDFNDNFIQVLGIPQIDFPKQVIIIAKSYNMMIIRNGKAKVLFR